MKNDNNSYIHPFSDEIQSFVKEIKENASTFEQFVDNLFRWFDDQITYSRLQHPFFPLQRSDIDVLRMKSGTCGDYSNLIVSVLITYGIPAKYALISKDCYGDEQDHICAAALIDGKWSLIDATLPYRKWFGYPCYHQEYELVDPDNFEHRMKLIEYDCIEKANKWGVPNYAGLLYAPWIHDEVVLSTDNRIDSVFYLLIFDAPSKWSLFVNYMSYTKESGRTLIMFTATEGEEKYQFSINEAKNVWDDNQWGDYFLYDDIPAQYITSELQRMKSNTEKISPYILGIINLLK